jgi:hypothetical protein
MSAKDHDCGYEFPKILEVSTEPEILIQALEELVLHAACPKCGVHVDISVTLAQEGKVLS